MSLLAQLRLRIDRRFRPRMFNRLLCDCLLRELIYAKSRVEAVKAREQEDLSVWRDYWASRQQSLVDYQAKFASYGFDSLEEYVHRDPDELELDLYDEAQDWMRAMLTPEAQDDYDNTINQHQGEIDTCHKLLADIGRMTPMVADNLKLDYDRIVELFHDEDCAYVLAMESIIALDEAIASHYLGMEHTV